MTSQVHARARRKPARAGVASRLGLAVAALSLALAVRARVYEMGSEFHTVSTDVPTPHTAWARPLAGGPLRLLVVAPRFAHRETAELMQRLGCECDVVMVHSYKQLGAASEVVGLREPEVLQALRAALGRPHDAIVLGNVPWSLVPKALQYEILSQVASGAGLLHVPYTEGVPPLFRRLFTACDVPQLLREGVPWGAFASLCGPPADTPGSAATTDAEPESTMRLCGTLKQGRCLVLRWSRGAGGFHCLTSEPSDGLEYDYNMALVVRALLWLTRREPRVAVGIDEPAAAGTAVPVTLTGIRRTDSPTFVIRDAFGDEEHRGRLDWADEHATAALPAALKGGRHVLDVFVREARGGAICGWASRALRVERDGPIAAVVTDSDCYGIGDRVTVDVDFARPPTRSARLVLTATDIHGRDWGRAVRPVKAEAGSVRLSFEARGMLSTHSRLRADLVGENGVLQRAYGELFCPLRRRPDFCLGAWGGGGNSWLSRQRMTHARDAGLETVVFSGDIRAGVRPCPYSTTSFRHGGKGDVRKPCLTDPAFWEKETERLHKVARTHRRADVFAYSLGDEICLDVGNTSLCRSPTCLAAFRAWLRERYGSLPRLNESWDTAFAAWEEVVPQSRKQASDTGNLAPWLTHRLFMDRVFAEGLRRARDILHELDPETPVGAEGLWGSASAYGMDWPQLAESLDFLGPYWDNRTTIECIRSFRKPDTVTATWFGNYGEKGIDRDLLRWLPWNAVVNGWTSVWWYAEYRAVQFGATATGWAPDFRPTHGLATALREVAEIRNGVAALLRGARRMHDGIAVLYSRPGIHIWGDVANDVLVALEDLGLQAEMVSTSDLATDRLEVGQYRALILPGVAALSEAEAERIRRFVELGGAALAVLPPALYDANGRPGPSPLGPTFGFSSADPAIGKVSAAVKPPDGPAFRIGRRAALELCEQAEAIAPFDDGSPAAVRLRVGRGRAVLLAFGFDGYARARAGRDGDLELRAFLRAVLEEMGVQPAVRVEADRPVRGLELCRFSDGVNTYTALTLEPLGRRLRQIRPHDLRLRFQGRRLTYDVRKGARIGVVDSVDARLGCGDALLLARLDQEPVPPVLRLASDLVDPGAEVVAGILPRAGPRRVLYCTVTQPDGRVADFWSRTVVAGRQGGEMRMSVALNAPAGSYVVRCRDVATGQTAEDVFRVR